MTLYSYKWIINLVRVKAWVKYVRLEHQTADKFWVICFQYLPWLFTKIRNSLLDCFSEPEKSKPAPLAPVTYISKDPVCKLPEMPIECGFNITERENCEKIGCCFNPGGLPDGGFCYHAECQLPKDQNPCLNGGKCIQECSYYHDLLKYLS